MCCSFSIRFSRMIDRSCGFVFIRQVGTIRRMANLRHALYEWRNSEAAKRSVELFRVLPNSTLDEIVRTLPTTKEQLITIKGIKEAKFREYGSTILAIVSEFGGVTRDQHETLPSSERNEEEGKGEITLSVSDYLDVVNRMLMRVVVRVRGEVTSFKFPGNAAYFAIKDAQTDSLLNVFMWRSDVELSGVEIREGVEVVVTGASEVYKPYGRFSFRAQTVELVGEGVLQAAYMALKKKLDEEGLFLPDRKRPLPDLPERIGLITSREGAVIHDFLNNLGRYGFSISFVDSRVEGVVAVKDLLAAMKRLAREPIDVLVLVRGGGSLESLQAFNNEHVVRTIAEFPVPVICAIGHDKDIPLAQLVADLAPSTPTATTVLLNASWEEAVTELSFLSHNLVSGFGAILSDHARELELSRGMLSLALSRLRTRFIEATHAVLEHLPVLRRSLFEHERHAREGFERIIALYRGYLAETAEDLRDISALLSIHDPFRQLRLGYGILTKKHKILRSVAEIEEGESFEARLSDGTLKATVMERTMNN